MRWWWKPKKPAPSSIQEATERAEEVSRQAKQRYRELLDQQPEVWRAVHRAERLNRINHFKEDLEEAIMRRRPA